MTELTATCLQKTQQIDDLHPGMDALLLTVFEYPVGQTVCEATLNPRLTPFSNKIAPLALTAAHDLQTALADRKDLDFKEGKMFGVLVVRTTIGLRYLAAYSGKLSGKWDLAGFVPPPFDVSAVNLLLRDVETDLHGLKELKRFLRIDDRLSHIGANHRQLQDSHKAEHVALVEQHQKRRAGRQLQRRAHAESAIGSGRSKMQASIAQLDRQSSDDKQARKALNKNYRQQLAKSSRQLEQLRALQDCFETVRGNLSAQAQRRYFDLFDVVDRAGYPIDVAHLDADRLPPGGTGECAGAKLLCYANRYNLESIAMAEFWWGPPPAGEIRHHGAFYPSCRSKCGQLLPRLLEGSTASSLSPSMVSAIKTSHLQRGGTTASTAVTDPHAVDVFNAQKLPVLYEDDYLAVVDKPTAVLSVPGKIDKRSVYEWACEHWPKADGPLMVHRLDMDTSGLLLIAKNAISHRLLQQQFERGDVTKTYTALLENPLSTDQGTINLPIRPDIDDRPRQLVCHQYGRKSATNWQVIETSDYCRVDLQPVTGRTHQLRVHCASPQGLNSPIVGDPLYGDSARAINTESDELSRSGSPSTPPRISQRRLMLHARRLEFHHPVYGKLVSVESDVPF